MNALARSLFPVFHVLGAVLAFFSLTMLAPLAVALLGGEPGALAYDRAFLVTLVCGGLLWLSTQRYRRELTPRDGFLLVALVWTVLPAFATLPLLWR
ncbi:MAG: TrkH family potassium uptake protein, partial [Burkholderiaceae bacterium]|nr:TrkH family potassium uptake protein [Burkholderiaceae bacterium]